MNFLKRLFGLGTGSRKTSDDSKTRDGVKKRVDDDYFALLDELQTANRQHKYDRVLSLSLRSLPELKHLILAERARNDGEFGISEIPAIEIGLSAAAVVGDANAIDSIEAAIKTFPELQRWSTWPLAARNDLRFANKLRTFLHQNPGTRQADLTKLLGEPPDYRPASTQICFMLEKLGVVRREREGRTYRLFLNT